MGKTQNLTRRRQKLYIKAYAILCLFIAVGMGYYSYSNWEKYTTLKDRLADNVLLADDLRTASAEESSYYSEAKESFDKMNKDIEKSLLAVFPTNDDYTQLVRQMDAVEEELSTKSNPFEVSNLDFQEPSVEEDYSVLPFRMSIRSSAYNFTKFLHLIETSGALDSDVRLMDISSIRLNFEETGADEKSTIINFTIQINAYFQ